MQLTLTQFLTLDGVSQGPGSSTEDTSDGFGRGGWLVPHLDEEFVRQASDWLELADALLLGRRTYQAFARDWPAITDPDDPFTERMNRLPKYVVSGSLSSADWAPGTVLSGDAVQEVRELKRRPGRELQIHGSARLGGALFTAGLVDVVRLVIAPVVLGSGRRLFTGTSVSGPTAAPGPVGLVPLRQRLTPGGLLIAEYRTAGTAPLADYTGVAALS